MESTNNKGDCTGTVPVRCGCDSQPGKTDVELSEGSRVLSDQLCASWKQECPSKPKKKY